MLNKLGQMLLRVRVVLLSISRNRVLRTDNQRTKIIMIRNMASNALEGTKITFTFTSSNKGMQLILKASNFHYKQFKAVK